MSVDVNKLYGTKSMVVQGHNQASQGWTRTHNPCTKRVMLQSLVLRSSNSSPLHLRPLYILLHPDILSSLTNNLRSELSSRRSSELNRKHITFEIESLPPKNLHCQLRTTVATRATVATPGVLRSPRYFILLCLRQSGTSICPRWRHK